MTDLWSGLERFSRTVDKISVGAGRLTSYLVLVSIALISVSVVMRYFFSLTYIALDEIQYYCYSLVFLFGFSYVFKENGHIRVDVVNSRLPERTRTWINLLGGLFLTIPWAAAVCYYSFKYFQRSFKVLESSKEAGGLPAIYILKFILVIAFVLLLFQAFSSVIGCLGRLRRAEN